MTEPGGFVGVVTAEVVGRAEHPTDLTPEEREHLGLPADEQQQKESR